MCSKCHYYGEKKSNVDRHVKTCHPGATTKKVRGKFSDIQEVPMNQPSLKHGVDNFFNGFLDLTSEGSKIIRKMSFYTDAVRFVSLGAMKDIVLCFTKFIVMFYGWQSLKPEFRSIWLSDKYMYVKVKDNSRVMKFPKDDRHKIIVLSYIYELFQYLSSREVMDDTIRTYSNQSYALKNCVTNIHNGLRSWTEPGKTWSLKDLVTRKRNSDVQRLLLKHFDSMFWYITPLLAHGNSPYLQMISKNTALTKIYNEQPLLGQGSASTETPGQLHGNCSMPDAWIDGYYCECGLTTPFVFSMTRHARTYDHTYQKGVFKLSHFIADETIPSLTDPMEGIPASIRCRIKLQNIANHRNSRNVQDILDDMDCDLEGRYADILKSWQESQVTEDLFMRFISLCYGKELKDKKDAWFWIVENRGERYIAYPSQVTLAFLVSSKEDGWFGVLYGAWMEYVRQFNPVRHEPPSLGNRTPSFYEMCEDSIRTKGKKHTSEINSLMKRVYDQFPVIYV
jgi:hypothetical protein